MPDLVAVLRDADGNSLNQLVEILDVQKMTSVGGWRGGDSPDSKPTSCTFSPNYKNVCALIGVQYHGLLRANK
jgi:nucleoporin NUP159